MATRDRSPRPCAEMDTTPFESAECAWFWFIQAQQARNDGARIIMGLADVPRPCEPIDIFKVIDRLYRNRMLLMDHILVLRHYGRRLMPPDSRRVREARAHKIWTEAFGHIGPVLERKGIVRAPDRRGPSWFLEACVYESDIGSDR
ncbi:MAG: hypothetical protein H6862_07490 [Rhodospirillales bacterium]|nr:hypothetical protein [Rhodospirillales bacterium]